MDVVVRQSIAIFQQFASEHQSLICNLDILLVLDLLLDTFDAVREFDAESDFSALDKGQTTDPDTWVEKQVRHTASKSNRVG